METFCENLFRLSDVQWFMSNKIEMISSLLQQAFPGISNIFKQYIQARLNKPRIGMKNIGDSSNVFVSFVPDITYGKHLTHAFLELKKQYIILHERESIFVLINQKVPNSRV